MKTLSLVFKTILIATFTITLTSCPDDPAEPKPDAQFEYPSGTLTAPVNVSFVNQSTNATSYLWDFGDNGYSTFTSPTHKYDKGGNYTVKLKAFGAGGADSISKIVTIANAPTTDPTFYDDFSAGHTKWSFQSAIYSVSNEQLSLEAQSADYDPIAIHSFSGNAQIPWRYKADVIIVGTESGEQVPGIVVITDDEGTEGIQAMWFGLMKNNLTGNNWIWLWYIVSEDMEDGWYYWDETCIGASMDVSITDWNSIEMVANANKTFTFIINDVPIEVNNSAIADYESNTMASVTLGISQIWLRGTSASTNWDNVEFEGTAPTAQIEKGFKGDETLLKHKAASSLKETLKNGGFKSLKSVLEK